VIHWHRHSEFSRLDGTGTALQDAERAWEMGQPALAQTDHGTLSGALHHIIACLNSPDSKGKRPRKGDPIIPVSGVEAYFRPDRAKAKADKETSAWHMCLFAKNLEGWHNLLHIVSQAYQEVEDGGGFYNYPCVDPELLRKYSKGLMCSTACVSSWLNHCIEIGDSRMASEHLNELLNIFGDDLSIEIMPTDFDGQRVYNLEIVRMAAERGIRVIATNDAHFPYKEWAETHRVVKMCGSQSSFKQAAIDIENGKAGYLAELNPTLYLAHEEEMRLWFQKAHPDLSEAVVDEAIANTHDKLTRITPFMLDRTVKFPKVSKSPEESERIMRSWIEEGLERIFDEYEPEHWDKWPKQLYRDRVAEEWSVLKSKSDKGLPLVDEDGKLILGKFGQMQYDGKKKPIRVGPGRGSAAGCLISYLIGIVAIDPISYGLLFERFLNPERKGMPDIDIDFQSSKRPVVKEYAIRKYGKDHVADIITHSTFQPKAVLQDMCRVYDIEFLEAKKVTDTIDIRQDDEETTLLQLVEINDTLAEFAEAHPELWRDALRLEGQVRNAGKHAAGVIITPKPISDYMALERGKKGDLVTSWSDAADFPVVSDFGFMKIDFLGIQSLDKHDYACELLEQLTGEYVDLNSLPALHNPYLVEREAMDIFSHGMTTGVFQFSGRGITKLLRQIKPDNIHDLAAANALYRPGPLKGGTTWEYPKRKHNKFLRTYQHPSLKTWLEETYGIIAFQEQVMQVYKGIGKDATGAEADDLRKAMGKLYRIKGGTAAKDFMGRFEEKWFAGTAELGWDRTDAELVWDMFLEFGHYGFNKSHSEAYSVQAYQDAWLKMNRNALAGYAAILTYPSGTKPEEKRAFIEQTLREMAVRGIEILPPDINRSGIGWTVDGDKLRMGLKMVTGIGEASAEAIVKRQPFDDFDEFVRQAKNNDGSSINPEGLIKAGAFDSLADRAYLLSDIPKIGSRSDARWTVWEHLKHNIKLKRGPRDVPEDRVEPDQEQLAAWQFASLDVTGDDELPDEQIAYLRENVHTQEEVEAIESGTEVIVGGQITEVKWKQTKKGKQYANVRLRFELSEWNVKLWEPDCIIHEELLQEGKVVMFSGRKDEWNGYISVVVNEAALLEHVIEMVEAEA
jgi:DNA polymerase-3 subunit alpha